MPIKILKPWEKPPVKSLTAVIYGQPGIGKTTLGFSSDKPLLLDFDDGGSARALLDGDVVLVDEWQEIAGMRAADVDDYSTVVVDTAGAALDKLALDIIRRDPKTGRSGGSLTLQGYGQLKSEFLGWCRFVRSLETDLIFLAHSTEDKQGDETVERISMSGGSKDEVYRVADLMGRIYMDGGRRVLNFSPTDVSYGKNPAQLPVLNIPNSETGMTGFLSSIMGRTRDAINADRESIALKRKEIVEREAALEDYRMGISDLEIDEINEEVSRIENDPEMGAATFGDVQNLKRIVHSVASGHGWRFDADKHIYVEPDEALL